MTGNGWEKTNLDWPVFVSVIWRNPMISGHDIISMLESIMSSKKERVNKEKSEQKKYERMIEREEELSHKKISFKRKKLIMTIFP